MVMRKKAQFGKSRRMRLIFLGDKGVGKNYLTPIKKIVLEVPLARVMKGSGL
jgi:hypothetical protein